MPASAMVPPGDGAERGPGRDPFALRSRAVEPGRVPFALRSRAAEHGVSKGVPFALRSRAAELATLVGWTRGQRPLVRALLVAVFAVGVEWLRGDAWYLRFHWYTVPHALAQAPICIAGARWVGVYGLSLLIWLLAAWGAFGRRWIWAGFALLPAFALTLPPVDAPDRRALLLQAEGDGGADALIPRVREREIDLAVLPEYAYFVSPDEAVSYDPGPDELARTLSSPVVFGAVDGRYRSRDFQGVAAVLDADGRLLGTFPKQHPVPLFLDGRPGTRRELFRLPQGTLGVAICFDFDSPEVASWLVRHGATLRLRAVENDRWILRAASSGRSEAVDPRGSPSREGVAIDESRTAVVPYGHRTTLPPGAYASFLGPAAGAATLLALLFFVARGVRARARRRRVVVAQPVGGEGSTKLQRQETRQVVTCRVHGASFRT